MGVLGTFLNSQPFIALFLVSGLDDEHREPAGLHRGGRRCTAGLIVRCRTAGL